MRLTLAIIFMFFSCYSLSLTQDFKLKNGLQIVVREDHRAPVAIVMVWYNIGSADEVGGQTGIAHALEHMMFKGTSKYPAGMFTKILAMIGGELNAFTDYDYTAYYDNVETAQLATIFKLEADRMQNLLLSDQEFAKEINVVKEERRLRTDDVPAELTLERYFAAAHLAMPYQHPVIGWMSDLEQMRVHDLQEWYQRFYAPNNATLVVVGDVTSTAIKQLAQQYFSKIRKQTHYKRNLQSEPPSLGKKTVHVAVTAKIPTFIFGYKVPSINTTEKIWEPYTLELISCILGADEVGRFAKNLIRGSQIANNININYNLYSRFETQFIFVAIPSKTTTIAKLKSGMLKELKRLQEEPLTNAELEYAKNQLIAQKTFAKDSIFDQAIEVGLLETLGVGWQTSEKYMERISAITPQQIQEVAQRYFQEKAMTEAIQQQLPLSSR